jgi:Tfp pilus assembly protein PilW
MTTSARLIDAPRTRRTPPTPPRAFTLAEVMIAAALSTFVLAGVLSAFVFFGRSGFRTSGVGEMDAEVRRGLETFAEDARRATDLRWNDAQSLTLFVPTSDGQVTYAYDSSTGRPTSGCFYRVVGDASSTAGRRILVHGVAPDFAFRRYKIEQSGVSDNTATNDLETKQIQLLLRAQRTSVATAGANQSVVSARYVLRNKRVTN